MKSGQPFGNIRRAIATYATAGVAIAAIVAILFPIDFAPSVVWLMLPGLALLAEFLPVEISRRGLRITFSLPYVAGFAAAVGPTGAIAADVCVTVIAAIALGLRQKQKPQPIWLLANLSISAVSAGVAGLFFGVLANAFGKHAGGATLAAVAFTITYALINFALVTYLDSLTSRSSLADNILSSLRLGVQGVGLYCLVAVAVAVLVFKGHYYLVAFTILPIGALRAVLLLKARMYEHYYETITALTLMLQRAHPYTHGHLERVARVSEEVALRLGLPSSQARLVREAAVLHDIGKIAIDEAILDKPSRLSADEMDHVRRHAGYGAEILSSIGPLQPMVHWIRHHHERPDGTGYPDGLSDVEIPVESKIIAVVDAFDAMTGGEMGSDRRPYRESMSPAEALFELERCAGSQFDARVVTAFREVVVGGYA